MLTLSSRRTARKTSTIRTACRACLTDLKCWPANIGQLNNRGIPVFRIAAFLMLAFSVCSCAIADQPANDVANSSNQANIDPMLLQLYAEYAHHVSSLYASANTSRLINSPPACKCPPRPLHKFTHRVVSALLSGNKLCPEKCFAILAITRHPDANPDLRTIW